MQIVFLNSAKIGTDISYKKLYTLGTVTIYEKTLRADILDRIKNAEIILSTIDTPINKDIIENAPKLKMISLLATGSDSVDMTAALKAGIVVKTATSYATNSVAQHTFALLFYVLNKIQYYNGFILNGKWKDNSAFDSFQEKWTGISGKNFGIIGFGPIGQKVAQIAKSFGCSVYYHSTSGKNYSKEFKHVSIDELLEKSDIVSIHAPKNEKTYNLINIKKISLMKASAVLLNLGRGGIVNEKDLAYALDNNLINFACIDVFEKEPIDYTNSPLIHIKNKHKLILTPHIAWASNETRQNLLDIAIDNIENYILSKNR